MKRDRYKRHALIFVSLLSIILLPLTEPVSIPQLYKPERRGVEERDRTDKQGRIIDNFDDERLYEPLFMDEKLKYSQIEGLKSETTEDNTSRGHRSLQQEQQRSQGVFIISGSINKNVHACLVCMFSLLETITGSESRRHGNIKELNKQKNMDNYI